MSQQLKCHKNWNLTKTKMSLKLKCQENWNVTITEILPNLKMPSKSKSKSKLKPRRSALITFILFVYYTTLYWAARTVLYWTQVHYTFSKVGVANNICTSSEQNSIALYGHMRHWTIILISWPIKVPTHAEVSEGARNVQTFEILFCLGGKNFIFKNILSQFFC